MAKRIWKYSIGFRSLTEDPAEVLLPWPAKILGAGPHWDDVNAVEFWAEVDDDHAADNRRFKVLGTGDEVPKWAEHLFTFRDPRNAHVWHLYDVDAVDWPAFVAGLSR